MPADAAGAATRGGRLPNGTLTFLAASVPDLDPRAWSELVTGHGGIAVGEPARDSRWVAVFTRPSDALSAALDTSSTLGRRGRGWTARAAVHTAVSEPHGGCYPESALAPVVGLCDAGQPGDALLSSTTAELARDDLPEGSTLVDLGAVRLPGLARRMRVWRLRHHDLPDPRGPLSTVDALLHGLPEPATSFLGRASEVAETVELLGAHRLVSLVGVGGIGKTRLAVAAAVECASTGRVGVADGVYFVDLAPLDGPEMMWAALAQSTRASERTGGTLQDAVVGFFRELEALLVLDNGEHLLDEVGRVIALLLDAAPRLRILLTSRQRLGADEERVIVVGPLATPDALTLFGDRAIAALPAFDPDASQPAIAEICRHLDGVPLAIELVAARADVATPEALTARLQTQGSLAAQAPRADARHASVRPAIEWSFERLSPLEVTLLQRLAVFVGGFDASAVDAVCGYPPLDGVDRFALLTALIDHSLIRTDEGSSGRRYRLLEPVRELARERLEASEGAHTATGRHFAWYRGLAAEAERAMKTASETPWLDRLEVERDNLLAALHWQDATHDERAAYAAALGLYWEARGHWSEGRHELTRCLDGELAPLARARVEMRLGVLEMRLGNTRQAEVLLDAAATEFQQQGDWHGQREAFSWLAMAHSRLGDDDKARTYGRQAVSVATDAGDDRARGHALDYLAQVEHQAGAFDAVLANQLEALSAFRAANDRHGEGHALHGVGRALLALGDLDGARRRIGEARGLFVELGDPFGRAVTALGLGRVELAARQPRAALDPLGQALDGMAGLRAARGIGHALNGIALSALDLGEVEDGVRLLGATSRLFDDIAMALNASEQEQYERALAQARVKLGAAVVHELWESGRATPTRSAVNVGLRLVADCAVATATAVPTAALPSTRVFRTEGEQVRVEFDSEILFVARVKGTDYLARLLAHPDEEFHALELAGHAGSLPTDGEGVGPGLDAKAKEAYRRRLLELDDELDEADRLGDVDRAARAQLEIDALARQFSAAVGLYGRDRAVGTAAERARQSVTKAIKSAVARIARQSPTVGHHLSTTVRTGTFCSYAPGAPIRWET